MAKVIGPLLSQEASGTVGKSITFARRRGQNIARGYATPSNPQTDNQIIVRIRFAAVGITTRRIRSTDWTYDAETLTWIEFYRSRVRTGEVWNSRLNSEQLGPNGANYDTALVEFLALDPAVITLWENEAISAIPLLPGYTRGTTFITPGFQLFLAERTLAAAGYGDAFNPLVPVTIVAG